MKTPTDARPTEATVSAYERLRERCLEPHPQIDGELGLGVLLRDGMLAWTRACSSILYMAHTDPMPLDTARIPSPLHESLIDVMVAMAMSLWRSDHHGAPQA